MLSRASIPHVRIVSGLLSCLACALGAPAAATSQGFSVGPIHVAVPAEDGVQSIQVRNGNLARPLLIQVTAFEWRETVDGRVQIPTTELTVSPDVFKLPAAGVRDLIISTPSGPVPRYYRLRVEELAPGHDAAPEKAQIGMLAAFDIPVFVEASGAEENVQAFVERAPDGRRVSIELRNHGGRFAVGTVARLIRDGSVVAEVSGPHYVLPGSVTSVSFELPNHEVDGDLGDGGLDQSELAFEVERRDGSILVAGRLPAGVSGNQSDRRR